jgi:SAM-dependent methyltransferase
LGATVTIVCRWYLPDGVSSSGQGNPGYLAFHQPRFAFLLEIVRQQVAGTARILDVGPSPFTAMVREALHIPVDTLGLEPEARSERGRHFHFNLNDTQHGSKWRLDFGRYDLIVFAEVIEHLFTAPEIVLAYLRDLLAPGGQLLLQTPNAASLRKRIKLALGRNPFERIRLDPSNPGHFREYTARELAEILAHSGFAVRQSWTQFYFDARHARHEIGTEPPNRLRGTVVNLANRALPGFLREGITILAARA